MTERRTREEMLTEVIRMFGHEAPETIDFARKCETYPDNNLSLDRLEGEIAKMKTKEWWAEG